METREYVQKLKEFTKEKGISIYEYFYAYAMTVRSNKKFTLPDFELNNPFLTENDIKILIENQNPRIVEYYAHVMTKCISLQQEDITRKEVQEVIDGKLEETSVFGRDNIIEAINEQLDSDLTRGDIEEVIEEQMDKEPTFKVVVTSIGKKIADILNGFAVVREDKTKRTHLYYHDAAKDSLKGEKVFLNDQLKVESGYYVNYQEYIDQMLDEIVSKYPAPEEIRFVREDGVERSLNEVLEEAFAILRKQGSLRFGKELQGKKFTSYKELCNLQLEGTETYANEPLRVGVYVRRDALTRIFAKYQAKVTMIEEDTKQSTK